jgi:hypothetical protein
MITYRIPPEKRGERKRKKKVFEHAIPSPSSAPLIIIFCSFLPRVYGKRWPWTP